MSTTEFIRSKVEVLSLSNVADGAAVEQFDAAIEKVVALIHEHGDSEDAGVYTTKDGALEFTITTTTTIRHDPERRRTDVIVATTQKLPARKSVRRSLLLRADGFLTERDDVQLSLTKSRNSQE